MAVCPAVRVDGPVPRNERGVTFHAARLVPAPRSTIAWEEPTMAKVRSPVGPHVHAPKVVAAVPDAETGERW